MERVQTVFEAHTEFSPIQPVSKHNKQLFPTKSAYSLILILNALGECVFKRSVLECGCG